MNSGLTFWRRTASAVRDQRRRTRTGRFFEQLEEKLPLATLTFTEPTRNSGDGTYVVEQRQGQDVYVGQNYLYYDVNPTLLTDFQPGDTIFVRFDYYDEGSGRLRLRYDSVADGNIRTEVHSRSSTTDTQAFVSSFHVLPDTEFAGSLPGNSDFRIDTDGVPISVVVVSNEPFLESGLEWYDNPPWESPYAGPSRPVESSTLAGKVIAGYQGWFNTPNDIEDKGWDHWGEPGDWSVDQWPDPNDYDPTELFAVPGVTTQSGEQAYLFSSVDDSVVHRHFQWMRKHDIDGVFLQRFQSRFVAMNGDGSYSGPVQWQLTRVRDAAHLEGRTWAIEYDIQNAGDEAVRDLVIERVKQDWLYLTDPNGLDLASDSHYQREQGKPVVAIFGLYLNSGNQYSTAQQQELVNWFKSQGAYVVALAATSRTRRKYLTRGCTMRTSLGRDTSRDRAPTRRRRTR